MLHTINQSPFRGNNLTSCIRFAQPDDPILFMEDGVYAAQNGNKFSELISKLAKTNPLFTLTPDVKARGIQKVHADVKQMDYDGFVKLVEEHQVNSWL
ncbi:MAG: sulfurtransferase complex subunit TusB [Deltaproteobacteria bacterium]|jgi:tRNA 2-thiouridine synthesizing protein B|nr:sulfurtransferase complex subunit TusB [Deltaproteobacteria bacterium]MBT4266670.1 sulfurtransferase complex subunit TusB [Deltaproteobacteria bacterium]MBT4644711.1 sulfurtransferase complex subunit TusB [Deltaproteobacteria bacterium]MBT6504708.1 sulfurtransferase complex subunit TusB [Deltaproteobacteria bacterium]MBT6612285.1 sulfurtransferase complex subunit TusB [Deltaproteobacteria bacterium]